MKCPVCNTTDLLMNDRQGVEIDYCPQCRGVWLDRGELDKIIERTNIVPVQHPTPAPQSYREPGYSPSHLSPGHDNHGYKQQHGYGNHKHHKKKSLLSELFDF